MIDSTSNPSHFLCNHSGALNIERPAFQTCAHSFWSMALLHLSSHIRLFIFQVSNVPQNVINNMDNSYGFIIGRLVVHWKCTGEIISNWCTSVLWYSAVSIFYIAHLRSLFTSFYFVFSWLFLFVRCSFLYYLMLILFLQWFYKTNSRILHFVTMDAFSPFIFVFSIIISSLSFYLEEVFFYKSNVSYI